MNGRPPAQWTEADRYVGRACRYACKGQQYVLDVETPAPLRLRLEAANESKIEKACNGRKRELEGFELALREHAYKLRCNCSANAEARTRLDRQLQQLGKLREQYQAYGRWLQERRLNEHRQEFKEVLRAIRTEPEQVRNKRLYPELVRVVTQESLLLDNDGLMGVHLQRLHELLLRELAGDVDLQNEVYAQLRAALHDTYTWRALMNFGIASRILEAVFVTWQVDIDALASFGLGRGEEVTLLWRLAKDGPAAYLLWALERGADPNFRDEGGGSVLNIALDQGVESEHKDRRERERVVNLLVSSPKIAENTVGEGLMSLLRSRLESQDDDEKSVARRRHRCHRLIEVMLSSRNACEHIVAFDRNPDGGLLTEVYWNPPENYRVLNPYEVYLLFGVLHDHHPDNPSWPRRLCVPSGNPERQRLASDLQNATQSKWYKENRRLRDRVDSYIRQLRIPQ